MDDKNALLIHDLAAIAYRTQKALRGAPPGFASFRAASNVRTPHELVGHMDSVLGYACTFFVGGDYRVPPMPEFDAEISRFHVTISRLADLIAKETDWRAVTPEQLLQGPLADALTHAGQLAMLRRLAGHPVAPENFVFADVRASNLGPDQPMPVSPDEEWPERP
ncbi:MAG TPA: hypothetical protein VMT19_04240 [Thermoanaerobaculaceae bacterium]|nr:hypothetical protein [Thermoanaerobaculaceae bacterium]